MQFEAELLGKVWTFLNLRYQKTKQAASEKDN